MKKRAKKVTYNGRKGDDTFNFYTRPIQKPAPLNKYLVLSNLFLSATLILIMLIGLGVF